uniref:Uncharacterized protein n=1 Tax=Kalanchoe fedtschenkoi TaxID=63787 RepID=A0A7N0VDT4_KALFE
MYQPRGVDQSSGQQYGWNRTSRDYHNHLTQMMRTTSADVVVPHQYNPSVHHVFKTKPAASTTAQESLSPPPKAAGGKKKVRIAVQEKTVIHDQSGSSGAAEDSVDADADSFIRQKHKGFELCKWTTFNKAR